MHNRLKALIFSLFGLFCAGPGAAEPVTIAILGDSLVQGYGLAPDEGFVPQLQRWLTDRGQDVVLVNAGVSGDTTAGGLARVDWTLGPDIDGLVVSLGGNDVLRGISPESARANLDAILRVATDRDVAVLLVGIRAPGNFGPDYKLAFDAIFSELASLHKVALYADFLKVLFDLPDQTVMLRDYYQADALHPNAQGVALIVTDIGPSIMALAKVAAK